MKLFNILIRKNNFIFFFMIIAVINAKVNPLNPFLNPTLDQEDDVIAGLVRRFKNKDKCLKNPHTTKLLYFYQTHDIQYDQSHTLNKLTYKNLVQTNHELIAFNSINPFSSLQDEYFDSNEFISTLVYNQINLPCLNRSLVCTHNQLVREYQLDYPEIDFSVPRVILSRFDITKATNYCLVLVTDPFINLNNSPWICHDELSVLYKFQEELSEKIRINTTKFDFTMTYIIDNHEKVNGVMELQDDQLIFIRKDKKVLLQLSYKNINPYVIAMYSKENIIWTGITEQKPEEARCLKINRKDRVKIPEYFCVYYGRSDIAERKMLSIVESRWAVENYANKINNRIQKIFLVESISQISKLQTPNKDMDDSLLIPLKTEIRNQYFLGRHQLIMFVKLGKLLREKLEGEIIALKKRVIAKVCNSILICIKAIDYSLEKGLLPLTGNQERIAMDTQNPYNSLMPKSFLRIPFPNAGTIGRELIERILKLKPGKTYIEPIPEAIAGEVPNSTSIKKAFNTFNYLKDKTKRFETIEQLGNNCRTSIRLGTNYLRRKVALLFYMGTKDPFLSSFSKIRDRQFAEAN